jgi:hypothetical protein
VVTFRATRALLTALVALAGAGAWAGVGVTQLAPAPGDGPVTVFYPSSAPDRTVQRGPFTLQLADQGPLVRDRAFALSIAAVYGLINGLFVGRALRLWRLALRPQATAAA